MTTATPAAADGAAGVPTSASAAGSVTASAGGPGTASVGGPATLSTAGPATSTAGPLTADGGAGGPSTPVGGGALTPAADGVQQTDGGRSVEAAPGLRRFSFNQATTQGWPLPDLVDALARSGVPGIGLWREPVADHGVEKTARLVRDAGIAVTSLCRGGFFADAGWYDENRRAIDEAAALGTSVLVLVSGGLGGRDLAGARVHVADAIGRLVPHAREAGVTLAIEPLHPMFCSDRCVINTLEQALAIAERHEVGEVGVVIDTYHLWWDDRAPALVRRAGPRVSAFQLADWITPLPAGVLTGRGMPGAGCIDLPAWVSYVDSAGYAGPIEIEVFNTEVWARPGADVLAEAVAGYRAATATSNP